MKGGTNSQPAPALIKNIPSPGDEDSTFELGRLIPALIISGVLNISFLLLFMVVQVNSAQGSVNTELSMIESKVEEDESVKEKNLVNDEIGNDPDTATNYNLDRIEQVSVPGPVNPAESVGILNAPEGPPQTIPPPSGFGEMGQGGGITSPTTGPGTLYGATGGMPSGQQVPGGFGGRSGATREKMLKEGGGNSRSEACVAAGLKWLSRHQNVDGSWNPAHIQRDGKCNCGQAGHDDSMFGTALSLLPFMGAGETHRPVGKHGTYSKDVERGLKWIVAHQNGDGVLSGNGYIQGMAALVLCEAYGMTADPQLKGPAQRAITSVVNWQAADGGFRYAPKMAGDTSVAGWHIQALKSGQTAGLSIPNATLAGVNNFLDKVSTPDGGGVGYMTPQPTQRMTAVGMLCRQYMGWGPRHPGLNKGVDMIRRVPPSAAVKDMYYFYYATQVIHHMGGEGWDQWNGGMNGQKGMRDLLVDSQDQGLTDKKDQKGSWDPTGDSLGTQMGRLGHTCLCILTLEVYYRHLPLYKRELAAAKEEVIRN